MHTCDDCMFCYYRKRRIAALAGATEDGNVDRDETLAAPSAGARDPRTGADAHPRQPALPPSSPR